MIGTLIRDYADSLDARAADLDTEADAIEAEIGEIMASAFLRLGARFLNFRAAILRNIAGS